MPDRLLLSAPHMGSNERRYVEEVFDTNWVAPAGPMIDRFEGALTEYTGLSNVVALSSGSAALHLALRISGINTGDVVWCPTMTFIGGVAPVLYQGGTPVFLDVEPDTLLLDLRLFERALEERGVPKAVITTDLYGSAVDVLRMGALRDKFGFCWISDSAEAVGSTSHGRHAGVGADFTVLSFNGNKIITTSGGGALACRKVCHSERARFLATQARDPAPHYEHTTFGYNYRMSGICAAIGLGQLEVLDERVAARRAVHATYREILEGQAGFHFHEEPEGGTANRWLTTIEFNRAVISATLEEIRVALERDGIETRPLWKPMHMQPVFGNAATVGGAVAEHAFARGLCLPSGSAMKRDDVVRVADALLRAAR